MYYTTLFDTNHEYFILFILHHLEDQFDAPDGINMAGTDLVLPEDPVLEVPGRLFLGGGQEHLAVQGFRFQDPEIGRAHV